MDFTKYTNPYDFANPVTEEKLFSGRAEQLKEIKYYLNHGIKSQKPINLSLIGDRAAGKTSLLNMIEIEAKRLDYLTVRIDLDEGDKTSQLNFFFKVFDSLVNSAFDEGFFGGHSGSIFDEYLNQTSAYSIAQGVEFRPFLFPVQYAKAMEAGRTDVITSEINFKKDLDSIKKEVGKSIILLFDECNVLSDSRILLEKVRNIFMNKTNYMLVFTGTKDLFPVIDEIFSPIIRQFKKISVDEYQDLKETEMCVSRPIMDIGLVPSKVFDNSTFKELHNISEGKPYEIQLICHNMFKKLQEGTSSKMTLNHTVLEDVRIELETSQDLTDRPKLIEIKSLDKLSLESLNYICKSLGQAETKDILDLEYVIFEESRIPKEDLKNSLQNFLDKKILLNDDDDKLIFFGDDFDKLYTKYFARESGVSFEFNYFPLFINFYRGLKKVLKFENGFFNISDSENKDTKNAIDYFTKNLKIKINEDVLTNIYTHLFDFEAEKIIHAELSFMIKGVNMHLHIFYENANEIEHLKDYVTSVEKRINKIDANFVLKDFKTQSIDVPSKDMLNDKILDLDSDSLTTSIIKFHEFHYPFRHLFKNGDKFSSSLILDHCRAIWNLDFGEKQKFCSLENYNLINLGYIFMLNDELAKAKKCFQGVYKDGSYDISHLALNLYNIAILSIKQNKYLNIINDMEEVILLAKEYLETDEGNISSLCSCLLVPLKNDKGDIIFIEKESPNMINTAKEIIETFKS